jgi:uncharacterized protein YecT (DUF1311 family)
MYLSSNSLLERKMEDARYLRLHSVQSTAMSSKAVKAAVVIAILAGIGSRMRAQAIQVFDPEVDGQCQKALGHGPASDWVGDTRGFDLECAETDLQIEDVKLDEIRATMGKKSSTKESAFGALLGAFQAFRKAYMDLATKSCGGGNGCTSSNELGETHVVYQFLTMVEGFKKTGFPSFSAQDAAEAETKLNAGFKDALSSINSVCAEAKKTNKGEEGLCIADSELAAQRAWMRYRDAWIAYGAIEWPNVSADSWRAYLALQLLKGCNDCTSLV